MAKYAPVLLAIVAVLASIGVLWSLRGKGGRFAGSRSRNPGRIDESFQKLLLAIGNNPNWNPEGNPRWTDRQTAVIGGLAEFAAAVRKPPNLWPERDILRLCDKLVVAINAAGDDLLGYPSAELADFLVAAGFEPVAPGLASPQRQKEFYRHRMGQLVHALQTNGSLPVPDAEETYNRLTHAGWSG